MNQTIKKMQKYQNTKALNETTKKRKFEENLFNSNDGNVSKMRRVATSQILLPKDASERINSYLLTKELLVHNDYPVNLSLEELDQIYPSKKFSSFDQTKLICGRCKTKFQYSYKNPQAREGVILENNCKYHPKRPITEGTTT